MADRVLIACVFTIFGSASLAAQSTTLASQSSAGAPASDGTAFPHPRLSADGRYVAFESTATNLVPNDNNGFEDIFVRDRQLGTTELVSQSTSGHHGVYGSRAPSISADGRFVSFEGDSPNLVTGDTNETYDIFVRDRVLGTTEIASLGVGGVPSNGGSFAPSISNDGRYVAFESLAQNLVAGTTNSSRHIYVRDRSNGTTVRASVSTLGAHGNQDSKGASLSGDGRFVAFYSYASNLIPADASGGTPDIFVRDLQNDITELVSLSSLGVQANFGSLYPVISGDGRYVAFESEATNLIGSDANGNIEDIFVRDRVLGETLLASVTTTGGQPNNLSHDASISADGRYVVFACLAGNIVPGDTNGATDVYLRDLVGGTTERVSVNSDGVIGNNTSHLGSISADGRCVVFLSSASNLVPQAVPPFVYETYVRDRGPAIQAFCFGDGSGAACPCSNSGVPAHGCDNSAATGGAILAASGVARLSADTLTLTSSSELSSALSIVLQGNVSIAAANFGDGLRCAGGALLRLYVKNAVGGVATAPAPGDPSVSARSSALGDSIPAGAQRFYQTYYRDPNLGFCAAPAGNSWNVSSGLAIAWDS